MLCLKSYFVLLLLHCGYGLITDENIAKQWLEEYSKQAEKLYYQSILISWNYQTNLTDYNAGLASDQDLVLAEFSQETYRNTTLFAWRNFTDDDLKRQFSSLADGGTSVLNEENLKKLISIEEFLGKTYSTAELCHTDTDSNCLSLNPDLYGILAKSHDWNELLWVWKKWRDESGRKMKDKYEQYVKLRNMAAKINGHEDAGAYWRSWYEDDEFEAKCLALWTQIKPLYQQLHGYVKRKLKDLYKNNAEEFPETGHIPAHLLGNMWAQEWNNLQEYMTPYPGYPPLDVTSALIKQNYTAERIFRLAEDFFTSLGLSPMPQEFWEHSMMVKPEDRDVVCHASAWDFYNRKDFRIKQCTEINQFWMVTTHHEMGHIVYFMEYKNQSFLHKGGANPGFHEAVGDVIALSVSTPEHLKSVGLLDEISNSTEYDINYLMTQALERLAFLPFGFLVDQWRWSVFRNQTPPSEYNKKWWQLRCQHQGISPPVKRFSDDFDPGAKYHIAANVPYIRYFVSFVIQFQFHKALCDASGYSGHLHRCDIYNNTVAGEKLRNMLSLGTSQKWPDAMEAITGQREMDASALVEFFKPLSDWLEEQNTGYDITWEDDCPEGMVDADLYKPTDPPAVKPCVSKSANNYADATFILAMVILCIGQLR